MARVGIAVMGLAALLAIGCGQTRSDQDGDTHGGTVASEDTEPDKIDVASGSGVGGVISIPTATADAGATPATQPADAGTSTGYEGDGNVDFQLGTGDLTLLVIFDKSGSMASYWDDRSKWQVANDAFMAGIEGVLENLTIATIFFPQPGNCDVAPLDSELQFNFTPGLQFAERWTATAATRIPDGSTPLELAFRVADGAIRNAQDLGLLDDRFRVIVVTDGEPTCMDDEAVLTTLPSQWAELGVETHVLGLPGSSAAAMLLDAIAQAGGTGMHQSPGEPGQLADGLYQLAR